MVEVDATKQRQATAGPGETYYSPRTVAGWLLRWRELVELAQPTAGAVCYDARLSQQTPGRWPANPARYLEIMADIERAWVHLKGRWSLESLVVEYTMQGYELRTIEDHLRIRHGTAKPAFRRACRSMAETLGWVGGDEDE